MFFKSIILKGSCELHLKTSAKDGEKKKMKVVAEAKGWLVFPQENVLSGTTGTHQGHENSSRN